MRRCFLRAALSHNRTLAANCRKLVSTRTSWAIKAKAIASVFATRAAQIGFAARPEWLRRVFAATSASSKTQTAGGRRLRRALVELPHCPASAPMR